MIDRKWARHVVEQALAVRIHYLIPLILVLTAVNQTRAVSVGSELEVGVRDIDLTTGKGRLRRDYRVADAAAAACDADADAGQQEAQYHECVRLAVAQAQRECGKSASICLIGIDRFARVDPARRRFGAKSF